jgi:hypothetical protein
MKRRVMFLICLLVTFLPMSVMASLLTISNPSFEEPVKAYGTSTNGTITGWQSSSPTGFGVSHTTTSGTYGLSPVPDGVQVAWTSAYGLSSTSVGFYQTLSDTLQPGMTYTLKVAVGRWEWRWSPHNYDIYLKAGDSILASFTGNIFDIPKNTFIERELSYTVTTSDPNIGKQLTIMLSSGVSETNWDNVRLDATSAVPLPPSLFLFGSCLLGMAGLRLRLYLK